MKIRSVTAESATDPVKFHAPLKLQAPQNVYSGWPGGWQAD
jgi:hypothetical protein